MSRSVGAFANTTMSRLLAAVLLAADVSDASKRLARQLTAAGERAEDAVTTGNRAQVGQARQDLRTAIAKFVVADPADQATNP